MRVVQCGRSVVRAPAGTGVSCDLEQSGLGVEGKSSRGRGITAVYREGRAPGREL